jgi:hypothetical protein
MNIYTTVAHYNNLKLAEEWVKNILWYDSNSYILIFVPVKLKSKKRIFQADNISIYTYDNELYTHQMNQTWKKYLWNKKYISAFIPVWIHFLLQNNNRKVFYIDISFRFYQSGNNIFNLLDNYDVVLFPRGWCNSPDLNFSSFKKHFTDSFYSFDIMGANFNSKEIFQWWAENSLANYFPNNKKHLYHFENYTNLFSMLCENFYIEKCTKWNITNENIAFRMEFFSSVSDQFSQNSQVICAKNNVDLDFGTIQNTKTQMNIELKVFKEFYSESELYILPFLK